MMPNVSAQPEILMTCLRLQKIDPARNMRHYRMTIQQDLFGGSRLVRLWGRIGTNGYERIDMHPDEGRAMTAPLALADEKRRRGYGP